jgi:hypothetical protein
VVDRLEPAIEHRLFRGCGAVGREPVVLFALELERLQHLVGEAASFRLQRGVLGDEAQVHGAVSSSGRGSSQSMRARVAPVSRP